MSRWPVRSASSTASYSRRASHSQPRSTSTMATAPRTSAMPPMTMPATSAVKPMATSSGRNDGGGMCTPAGGVPRGAGSAPTAGAAGRRRAGHAVVVAHLLAAPVEERDDEDRRRRPTARCRPPTMPKTRKKAPIGGEERREATGRACGCPAGVTGVIRRLPRRVGPAVGEPQDQSTSGTGRRERRARRGISATSAPQSGTTNCSVNSMRLDQSSSIIAAVSAPREAGEQDVGHERHGDARGRSAS